MAQPRDSKCYYSNITRGLLFSVILSISFSLQIFSLNLSDGGGKETIRECLLLMTEVKLQKPSVTKRLQVVLNRNQKCI